MKRIWRALALFAYRRWARAEKRMPTGVPGNRDPEHPCEAYDPRPWLQDDWNTCMTDGHYLCRGCAHRSPAADENPNREDRQ